MPRLSQNEPVKVYVQTTTADRWQLLKQMQSFRITPLGDMEAMNEGARFGDAANPTHRGRCDYDAELAGFTGGARPLIVRLRDGAQFLALRWREGRSRRRAGNPTMIYSLTWIEERLHNLYDT